MKTPTLKTLPAHLLARVVGAPPGSDAQGGARPHVRPPAAPTVPTAAQSAVEKPVARRSKEQREQQEREPAPRPLFGTTQTPGFPGYRFVCVGLSEEQKDTLEAAARAAGVREGR